MRNDKKNLDEKINLSLLKEIGLAWTWFIFVAVTMNLAITNIFESLFYLRSDE